MKTFKIDDEDLAQACANLRDANKMLSEGNKKAKNAKLIIGQRLNALRGVSLEALEIGEIVNIEKLLMIEVGKQTRFDEKQFEIDEPETYQRYRKETPAVKYKPLI